MQRPKIVSRDEWTAARKRLLLKEKELTRQRDALAAERRTLPMVAIEKEYVFQGPEGRRTLADLFEGKRQLRLSLHVRSRIGATRGARPARSWPTASRAASCTSPR
jgi:predicted dithiol-disulfide oxidoreductase (DUF899 family)